MIVRGFYMSNVLVSEIICLRQDVVICAIIDLYMTGLGAAYPFSLIIMNKKNQKRIGKKNLKYIDLFAGIGGFHYAADSLDLDCVFSSDIDQYCQKSYFANFGIEQFGDITKIRAQEIPDHDVLLGGFPCQPFSIIGERRGFKDIRGTLFFDIARIIDEKRPAAFVLENVKALKGHNKGKTLERILDVLRNELNYSADAHVLNALDFGLPQKRERVFIVGLRDKELKFDWNFKKQPMKPLSEILEKNVDQKYFVSKAILKKRMTSHTPQCQPAIWHENKSGNVTSYPYSCALRAGASYNYLLVDGKRRLTPREMLRLQGFPDTFKIVNADHQTRKQAGNAVPVPMVKAVLGRLLEYLNEDSHLKGSTADSKNLVLQA